MSKLDSDTSFKILSSTRLRKMNLVLIWEGLLVDRKMLDKRQFDDAIDKEFTAIAIVRRIMKKRCSYY